MKSKKGLRIIAALVGIISVFTSFGFVAAFADDETPVTTKEYVLENASVDELAGVAVPFDYLKVKTGSNDKATVVAAADIDKVTVKYGATALDENGGKDANKRGYTYDNSKNTITYYESDAMAADDTVVEEYTLTVSMKEADKNNLKNFDVTVRLHVKGGNLAYVADADKIAAAQTKINEGTVTSNDTLALPFEEISGLITGSYADVKNIVYTLYYQAPGSTSFSTKSGEKGSIPKLTVSSEGRYLFYVLADDRRGNAMSVKDCEIYEKDGIVGYYELTKDSDDNVTAATLVAPIFEYEHTDDKQIEINTKGDTGKGRVNQRYQSLSVTVENADDVEFVLQYNAATGDENDEGWVDAENGDQAKFTADNFTSSRLYFTPLEKGYFRFKITAKGGKYGTETLTSYSGAIAVQNKVEELKLENEAVKNFFKNNWLSLVFLGIALLCLIGIIVVAFWKPTDKDAKAAKKVKETKTEDAAKITDASEVETPAEDEKTEEPTVEEVTDEPAETEVKEETTEEQSAETPAREVKEEEKGE